MCVLFCKLLPSDTCWHKKVGFVFTQYAENIAYIMQAGICMGVCGMLLSG